MDIFGGINLNNRFQNSQYDMMDILSIMSLVIGYSNLIENRQQSAHNDVQAANDRQEQHLLKEIKAMFEEQNQMLEEILTLLKNK